jgi:hypothetical protein
LIFCFGQAKDIKDQYRDLFGCEIGSLPFRYLGIPIYFRKLKNGEWKPVEDRFEKSVMVGLGSYYFMVIN